MAKLAANVHPILTQDAVDALAAKQLFTVLDFVTADTQLIITTTRITFKEAVVVKNFFFERYAAKPVNGFDHYQNALKNAAIIPTGIESVDRLLNGGLITGNIYELCGLPASGKTAFVLNLAKNVILNTKQNVLFLDTKNDISGSRLRNLLAGYDKGLQQEYLTRIIVQKTYTRWNLINGLYDLKSQLEENLKLRLVVIDSLPTVLLSSNDPMKNNAYLNHLANIMNYIAAKHHIVFLVTNLITTWTGGEFTNQQDLMETIACGKYWLSVPNSRLKIELSEDQKIYTLAVLRNGVLEVESSVNISRTKQGFS